MKKNFVLTILSVFLLLLFFILPANRKWFTNRIIAYWNDFRTQKNHLSIEERKKKRWENSYVFSKQIAGSLAEKADATNALVLIPPSAYFKNNGINYHVPEPAVFYYYTGVKTIWVNSSNVLKANWTVIADSSHLKLVPVTGKNVLPDSINSFKKYPLGL